MAYDDRHGEGRWRGGEREPGRESGRGREYGRDGGGFGPSGSDHGREPGRRGGPDQDRGFFERAGEEIRSFFGNGDEDDHGGGGRHDREHGSHRDNGYSDRGGGNSFGGGWGNQSGETWNQDRPGRSGWFTDSVGGERGHRQGAGGHGEYGAFRGGEAQRRGGEGRGPDQSRGGGGGGFGERFSGGMAHEGGGRSSAHRPMTGDHARGGQAHDPHYSEWRRRQMEDLDRNYDEYRREHQSKFETEFGGWRNKRQGQRQMLGKVADKMEVLGSDGSHVGTVDKVKGDRIILTKNDQNASGAHHSVPCSWVDNVDERVILNRTAEQAMNDWRDEERSRALFERPDQGSDGPHVLNRSFSGTYRDGDE
ncbi:MAG TPA: DUF2171 domain-containing protein [Allosphingosinicella sp.]|nr:DUF2171 domain-containing protein [Allosphingosinicella sp.]